MALQFTEREFIPVLLGGDINAYSVARALKELGVLILTGEYQPETPRIDELAMDGLREDDEEIGRAHV